MEKKITTIAGCLLTIFVIVIITMAALNIREVDPTPYVVDIDSRLFTQQWIASVDNPIVGTPIISGGNLIVQTSRNVKAIAIETGKLEWSVELKGNNKNQSPVSAGDILIITEETGNLIALKNKTGEVIWRDTHCTEITPQFSCEREDDIVIAYGSIISSRYLEELISYSIDTGLINWQLYLKDRCNGRLAVYFQKLLCLCGDQLFIIDIDTGFINKIILLDDIYNDIYKFDDKIILIKSRMDTPKTILDFYDPVSFELDRSVEISGMGAEQICESGEVYYLSGSGIVKVNLSNGVYQQILTGDRYSCPILFGNYLFIRKWTSNYLILNKDTYEIVSYLGDDNFTFEKSNPVDPVVSDDWIIAPIGKKHIIVLSLN